MTKSLKEYVYSDNGRAISARMNEAHLRANGYSAIVDDMLYATIEFNDMSFTERLRMFIFDKIYVAHCKTCNTTIREWNGDKWKMFCSRKCAQNDSDVKSRILAGQSNTNWADVIAKRELTMLNRYGYSAYSQSDQAKIEFSTRTKLAWEDPGKKLTGLKKELRLILRSMAWSILLKGMIKGLHRDTQYQKQSH